MSIQYLCANCDGTGWVCEDHPEVPWLDGESCCGGAGSPCSCSFDYEENVKLKNLNVQGEAE